MHQSRKMFARLLAILVSVTFGTTGWGEDGPHLNPEQQKVLAQLSPQVARECLELGKKGKEWKSICESIRKELEAGAKENVTLLEDVTEADSTKNVDELIRELSSRSPEFRKFVGIGPELQRRLDELQKLEQTLVIDAEEIVDADEEELRKLIANIGRTGGLRDVVDQISKILDFVEKLRDPAQVSQRLMEDLIAKKVFERPFPFGDVSLRIVAGDPSNLTTSLFSPDPGLNVSISYLQGDYQLMASGFYFRLENGIPVPMFDRLKWDPKQEFLALANRIGKRFANQIASGLDLPVSITRLEPLDFSQKDKKLRGALSLDIRFKLPEFLESFAFEAKNVTITTRGDVLLGEAGLTAENKLVVIPIGKTGYAFCGYKITLMPKAKEVSIESIITSIQNAKTPRVYGLEVTVTAPLSGPPKLTHKGQMLVAGAKFGDVDGTITQEKIDVNLEIPGRGGLPIDDIVKGNMHLEMDHDGIHGDGDVRLFQTAKTNNVHLELKNDGRGTFTSNDHFYLTSLVKATGTMAAEFELDLKSPTGFSSFDMLMNFTVDVDLQIYKPTASVVVRATVNPKPFIQVEAHAMRCRAAFEVEKLGDLTPNKIAEELAKELPEAMQLILEALAELERESGALLAHSELQMRNYVSNQMKIVGVDAIRTDNEEFNKAMGQVSKDGKALFETVAQDREKFGRTLVELRKNPVGAIGGGLSNIGNEVGKLGGKIGFGKKKDDDDDEENQRREELRIAAERQAKVDDRLKGLLSGIDCVNLLERPQLPRARQTQPKSVSGLTLACYNTTAAAEGDKDAVLGLLIRAAGYQVATKQRKIASDTRSATVRIKNLYGGESHPKVRIQVPKEIQHGSTYAAEVMLFDELAAAIEREIPDAEIEGYFHERKFAVRNLTSEPVRLWFQIMSRGNDGRRPWGWAPGGPGLHDRSQEVVLKPGEARVLRIGDDEARGMAARLWAESESGQIWRNYMSEDLWLVGETDHLGRHRYLAEEMGTFTYEFRPADSPRTFTERTLSLANETNETLTIEPSVWAFTIGKPANWRPVSKVTLKPRESIALKHTDGWLVRGNQIRVSAQDQAGQVYRWTTAASNPLTVVDAQGYRASRIGGCMVRLVSPGKSSGSPDVAQERTGKSTDWPLAADQVHVPDVTKISLRSARERLEVRSLQARSDQEAQDRDLVLEQSPQSGWREPKSTVLLTVGVSIPNVTNKALKTASDELRKIGLEVDYPRSADSESIVTTQRPEKGYARRRSLVVLAVKAPEPVLVAVPAVIGLAPDAAETKLKDAGFRVRWDRRSTRNEFVFEQHPAGEVKVDRKSNDIVVLTPGVDVPKIERRSLADAKSTLEKLGIPIDIEATSLLQTDDPQQDSQEVVDRQSISGRQPAGTHVGLSVVKYSLALVEVPRIVGMDSNQARTSIESRGFTFSPINDPDAGPVRDQRPAAGSFRPRKSTVVAVFPEGFKLPNLRGHSFGEVKKWLEANKLRFEVVNDSSQAVEGQQPAPQTLVREGDTITLIFPPPQTRRVKVRDFSGLNFEVATEWIQSHGLSGHAFGDATKTVINQHPAPTTVVPEGYKVLLYFPEATPNPPPGPPQPPPQPPPFDPRIILGRWLGDGVLIECSIGPQPNSPIQINVLEREDLVWVSRESGVVLVTPRILRIQTQFGTRDFAYGWIDGNHFDMSIHNEVMRFRRVPLK